LLRKSRSDSLNVKDRQARSSWVVLTKMWAD
jgi:hypothetical protein